MANTYSRFTAAPAASANRFVTSTNMIVGAYSLAASTMPTAGARKVTVTHTAVTGNDTLGTIAVVGTDVAGRTITDTITPTAGGTATGTKNFVTITSVTGAGWVISGGNDTITVGCDASQILLDSGGGQLISVIVNTTAAGTVTLADARGTIAVLKSSIVEGTYYYYIDIAGFLSVTQTAASDITVVYTTPTASSN